MRVLLASAVLALTLGAAAWAAAAPGKDPGVRVSPNPIGRGQDATVYGTDFCQARRCSEVTVVADGQVVGSATVARDGTFALRFRAPLSAGQHRVTARQSTQQGTLQASTGLVVRTTSTTTTTTTTATTTTTTTAATTTSVGPTSEVDPLIPGPTSSSSAFVVAGPPNDVGGEMVMDWIVWLLPASVGALIAIGLVAWRHRQV